MNFKNIKKEYLMKYGIVAGGIILVIILGVIIFNVANKRQAEKKEETKVQNKDALTEEITKLGKDYYENIFYAGLPEEKISDLVTFEDSGIQLPLTNLFLPSPLSEENKKVFDEQKCNEENSKVIFYPKSPYQASDYDIKIELFCEE